MFDTIIFYAHYIVLLLYGLFLSLGFAKITFTKKAVNVGMVLFFFCGIIQLLVYKLTKDSLLWEFYPLISHIPTVLVIWRYFKRSLPTAIAAVTASYLCCEPAKVAGMIAYSLTNNITIDYLIRIVFFIGYGICLLRYFRPYLSEILTRKDRGIYTFAFLPIGYYFYDYIMGIYTDLWYTSNELAREILPLFLFLTFIVVCILYYREYASREYAEQKEQLILTKATQQEAEIESIKHSYKEVRLIRHDMRHLLGNVAFLIENQESEKALALISDFTSHIDATVIQRYCENETFNYVIAAFASKCKAHNVDFSFDVDIDEITFNEILLSSILSNALENALNAQMELPEAKRNIKFLFKHSNGKLLISVKNPFQTRPTLVNGLPVSKRRGHGYGTKSIQYITEKLGGNCQFTIQDELFVVRIVL